MDRRCAPLALSLLASACSVSARDYGAELFDDPHLSTAESNLFRCATCHETTPAASHRPGYPLHTVAVRPSYWGGFVLNLLDAISQCITEFMRGRPLASSDDTARALFVYLSSLSPDPTAQALPFTVVRDIADVTSGDGEAGRVLYGEACAVCHGTPNAGEGGIGDTPRIPNDTVRDFGRDSFNGARPVTIEKVRHGKFFSIGGTMPPFSKESLSDSELGAILKYLETHGLPPL